MFKTYLLFQGGSAREAAERFFAGLGATIPPITTPAPQSQPQPVTPPISGTVTLAAEPPRSRKPSRSRHGDKSVTKMCEWRGCDREAAGPNAQYCVRCRQRARMK